MLFNSGQFLIFFPIVVLVYYVIPQKLKNYWLLIASYYFYMCWNAKYALLLFAATFVTYIGGLGIEKVKELDEDEAKKVKIKKAVFAIAVLLNLFMLFFFKYAKFALSVIEGIGRIIHVDFNAPAFDILLPVGISFYIFQALGYLIDVYRDDIYAEKNFFTYALFVSFFPQLVAGPIERSKNLLSQLSDKHDFDVKNIRDGLLIMLWGFFLKIVIADRCAVMVNTVYSNYEAFRGLQITLPQALFSIQIYGDFMGYSVIAQGAARVLGIRLMDNFRQPNFAVSIQDHWRRWHISLSTWFRDYVYIPLGGSRCSKWKKYRNIVLTFMISGLWHGASWNYVIWGTIHGLYQVIESLLRPFTDKFFALIRVRTDGPVLRVIKSLITYFFVSTAFVIFRSDTMPMAFKMYKSIYDLKGSFELLKNGIFDYGLNTFNLVLLVISLIILLVAGLMKEKGIKLLDWVGSKNIAVRYLIYWSFVLMILFSLDIAGKEFIYFQF